MRRKKKKKWLKSIARNAPALFIGINLAAFGILTGGWGYVILFAHLSALLVSFARRNYARRCPPLIALLMIPSLDSKIESVRRFQAEIEENVIAAARPFEAEIVDYNTEEQLFRLGQYSDGQAIEPPYAALTRQIKRASGQPADRVTLKDTGAFHRSFQITWRQRDFQITASDPKTGKLVRKYGREVFGLNAAGLDELASLARPELAEAFRKTMEA